VTHPNEELVRRGYGACGKGDTYAAGEFRN
jgi:hypothetical protein